MTDAAEKLIALLIGIEVKAILSSESGPDTPLRRLWLVTRVGSPRPVSYEVEIEAEGVQRYSDLNAAAIAFTSPATASLTLRLGST